MHPSWRAPESPLERLSPAQFRWMVALACLTIAVWDSLTELPTGFFYMLVVGLTFWSSDRWMPMAAGVASAVLIMIGLATPQGATSFRLALLFRVGGAAVFVASGWMIMRYRALLGEARDREAMLRTIFESEPACVKVVGPGGILLDMNRAGLDMIEASDLASVKGAALLSLVAEEHRDAFVRMCERVFAGESVTAQFELVGLKGRRRWVDSRNAPLRDAAGRVTGLLAVTQDVTDQKRAEAQRRLSEERLALATDMAGLGFFEQDYQQGTLYWSDRARSMFGMNPSETWTSDDLVKATHPDDRARLAAAARRLHDPNQGEISIEHRIVRPTGEVRHVKARGLMQFDTSGPVPRPRRSVATIWDVTEHKQAEAQRDALALRVLEAQENERRAVARDLHDEIGQALSALKLNLLRLRRGGAGAGPIVTDSLQIADEVLRHVRDIALSLRPSVLDDLGLGAAVQWYAEHAGARANLCVTCDIAADGAGLSAATKIACFRVLQEALTNVVRHAAATSVLVQLRDDGDSLELVVRDNGRGFDVDEANGNGGRMPSMGLLGMRERAALLGGVTMVTSAPGAGCEVRVRLPRVPQDGTVVEAVAVR